MAQYSSKLTYMQHMQQTIHTSNIIMICSRHRGAHEFVHCGRDQYHAHDEWNGKREHAVRFSVFACEMYIYIRTKLVECDRLPGSVADWNANKSEQNAKSEEKQIVCTKHQASSIFLYIPWIMRAPQWRLNRPYAEICQLLLVLVAKFTAIVSQDAIEFSECSLIGQYMRV